MRFDILLAQYLYKHKILNLPGIGTFEADNTVYIPDENDKQKPSLDGISFRPSNVLEADDSLIEFIKEQTGKMKPLAMSDLESYLTLGKQFLFIGKPFYLEGIGTLQLTKSGHFEFMPGEYVTTKLEDPNIERSEGKSKAVQEEDRVRQESNNNTLKKILLALGILAGIGVLGWGGMKMYNLNAVAPSAMNDTMTTGNENAPMSAQPDTLSMPAESLMDTSYLANSPTADTSDREMYKFVMESTEDALRARNRYNDLRSYGNKIQIETKDSVKYKLFYLISASPRDTLRIRDSLNRWYYRNSSGNRVKIEQP